MEPKVIFEDIDILVLDKPAGMIVNVSDTTKGERTVQEWIEEKILRYKDTKILSDKNDSPNILVSQYPSISDFINRSGIVHRLDKETSGILLVAKNPQAFENLQIQFKERKVKKTYTALVHGKIEQRAGEINIPVGRLPWNRKRFGVLAGGREAVTKYKILRYYDIKKLRNEKFTLLELYPQTGRTHQIRVHLKYFNHPIFSDPLYAGRKTARNDRKLLPRIFLHAAKISFYHPKTHELVSFENSLPEQLGQFLEKLHS